jgi:hypothetical protein
MEKEDINLIAQLLTGIKDALEQLEKGERKKDFEKVASAKKSILNFQMEINKLL